MDSFQIVAEDMRHDLIGTTKDQLADHGRRLAQLESGPGRTLSSTYNIPFTPREILMPSFLRTYGTTLGPVGIPMHDERAFALDAIFKQLPAEDQRLRKASIPSALLNLTAGERADISWITTETIDRDKEIVIAGGMRDDHLNHNPLVTLNHFYYLPPVGKSLWRKPVVITRCELQSHTFNRGVLAKTCYPPKPDDWADTWPSDEVLMLIQSGLLNGKSIGFIPMPGKRRSPTHVEIKANPSLADVRSIIEEWILLEYACCPIPCNPHTTVAVASKSLRSALGWYEPNTLPAASNQPAAIPDVQFTTESELRSAFDRHNRHARPQLRLPGASIAVHLQ